MGLRAKMFTAVGVLVCLYAVVIFFIPTYVIVKDLTEEGSQLHSLIVKKNERLLHAQEVLLREVFLRIRDDINSFLFVIYDMPYLQKMLSFPKPGTPDPVTALEQTWHALIRIVNYNPDIGILQLTSLDQKQNALLMPANAYLYDITTSKIDDGLLAVYVHHTREEKDEHEYLGVKLSEKFTDEYGHIYYALLPWGLTKDQLLNVRKNIDLFEEHFVRAAHLGVGQIFTNPSDKVIAAESWETKNDLIQILVPLVVSDYADYEKQEWVPIGVARFEQGHTDHGLALFSKEVMSQHPIVDGKAHYENNLPPPGAPTLAQGDLFITSKKIDHIYIANTLKSENFYLTVGTPIDSLARQLATWSDKNVVVRVGDELWLGYTNTGTRHEMHKEKEVIKIPDIHAKSGVIEIHGDLYHFMNLATLEQGHLGFYELSRLNGEMSIAKFSITVAKRVAWKIAFQLFIISLVLIGIIFILIARAALTHTIRPVTKLAEATECVVEGRYTDVILPEMGKRKDEIATLTSAFGEMVAGLQEKEKIRGVLDKVVSKDIADEILKSHIHLGGEDREISVLFVDIRGFTAMTENMEPQKTIEILNQAMTKMAHLIEAEGGIVDKFVGDEIMAIYGAPTSSPDHALKAVSTGVMIIKEIKKWNEERALSGDMPVHIGVGINSGIAVAGNMGAEDRLNYTVLGANVNLASRLCDYAKLDQLIISQQTFAEPNVQKTFFTEKLEPANLKGFSEPVSIYQVLDFNWDNE